MKGFHTLCLHSGQTPESNRGHLTPIYATSTYTFETAEQSESLFEGKESGFVYGRFGNPNTFELESKMAALEAYGLEQSPGVPLSLYAVAHASGMGAISSVLIHHLKPGDQILATPSLYGGTQELADRVLREMQIEMINADLQDPSAIEKVLQENPRIRLLYIETPTNPMLRCYDLEALTQSARQKGLLVCVDNTFATPYLQQPFRYGVDYVVHSTTKFLNGHGTAVGGILVGRTESGERDALTKTHRLLGAQANPFDTFMLLQGIKTLPLRMDRQTENAQKIAAYLQGHAAVSRVHYLGLPDHPDFELAQRQMRGPGAVLSFELMDGQAAAFRFLNRIKLCASAVSLGTCDTLVCHPASSTHRGVDPKIKAASGLTDGLLRMSVGLEDIDDLIADLESALKA